MIIIVISLIHIKYFAINNNNDINNKYNYLVTTILIFKKVVICVMLQITIKTIHFQPKTPFLVEKHILKNIFWNFFLIGSCGAWESYGSCSKSCGSGFKVRKRQCPVNSLHLQQQKTICNTNLCPGQGIKESITFI